MDFIEKNYESCRSLNSSLLQKCQEVFLTIFWCRKYIGYWPVRGVFISGTPCIHPWPVLNNHVTNKTRFFGSADSLLSTTVRSMSLQHTDRRISLMVILPFNQMRFHLESKRSSPELTELARRVTIQHWWSLVWRSQEFSSFEWSLLCW